MLKRLLLILALLVPGIAFAQTTTVTGTVVDASGNAYFPGTVSAYIVLNTGQPMPAGVPASGSIGPVATTAGGLFSVTLASPFSWQFTICGVPPSIGPRGNVTPNQVCFSTQPIAIAGGSQTITSNLPSPIPALGPGGGGGITPNSPVPQAQVGPGFNVKNYGALGDGQSSINCSTSGFTVACTDATYTTAADVGKEISCAAGNTTQLVRSTITSVTNSTTVVTGTASNQVGLTCSWGHNDDARLAAAQTDWLASFKAKVSGGNLGLLNADPVLYFPAGNYLVCNFALSVFAVADGIAVRGAVDDSSRITWATGCNGGAGNSLWGVGGSVQNMLVENLTLDGAAGLQTGTSFNAVMNLGGGVKLNNVHCQRFGIGTCIISQGTIYTNHLTVVANTGVGLSCQSCNGDIEDSVLSNSGQANLQIQNVVAVPNGNGLRIGRGVLVDECGVSAGNACATVQSSHGVYFEGASIFGAPSAYALSIDGNSFVHWVSGLAGVFGTDTNTGGIKIAAGGTLQAADLRMIQSGASTNSCMNNLGNLLDNGGLSCESQFKIVSGTSTGTTAVLTLTPAGANVNANCTVGDALTVEGAAIGGYNGYFQAGTTSGITAVTATTLTYTTQGSNLGALGAGGAAYCRNLQTYSGTLPKALLNNPIPNTCYVTITPIANATAVSMCNFAAQSATNVTRITAKSQATTTCATAPIVTITNGTVTQTLTLTSGKNTWDSFNSIDASTGIGTTIYKPSISLTGTDKITVTYDAGALASCTTPPTNFSVSYNISPILSN